VWTGYFGGLTSQGCDDDGGTSTQSDIVLTLNGGITYYIEVMRYSTSGSGGIMDLYVQAVTPPNPPSDVIATNGTYFNRVAVNWSDVSGADYYEVYRSNTADGSKIYLGGNPYSSFNDYTAAVKVVYYYWVKACSTTTGCSDYSSYNTGWRDAEFEIYLPVVIR